MEIIDKYGYLESAFNYISRNIVSGGGLYKIAKKSRIKEILLKNLSLSLKNFSEKQFITSLNEKIEESHSSLLGANAEISGVNISVETQNNKAFILMKIVSDIVVDGENEDRININIKIFSKNNIQVS